MNIWILSRVGICEFERIYYVKCLTGSCVLLSILLTQYVLEFYHYKRCEATQKGLDRLIILLDINNQRYQYFYVGKLRSLIA
jgi:hypothetical protein